LKKKILLAVCSFLLLAFILFYVPIGGFFTSKFVETKIKNRLRGNVKIGSSSVVILKKITIKDLQFDPIKKRGVPFSADKIVIEYNGLLNLIDPYGKRSDVTITNFSIKQGENNLLSGFNGLLSARDEKPAPLFKKIHISNFKVDKDTMKNVMSAQGEDFTLEGYGTENKNGNLIDYRVDITLYAKAKKRFAQFFPVMRADEDKPLKINLVVQGQPTNPYVVITSEQFKLNFRIVKPDG